MATPHELDTLTAKHLHEAKLLLQRGFAEGLGKSVRNAAGDLGPLHF
jgi:hypothetical protein